jgi:streptogramin lyase
VSEFSAGPGTAVRGIAAGPDGNLWFTEYHDRIGRITPGGKVTLFRAGISYQSYPTGIAAGPDGNLWFTEESDRIGQITPAGKVTEFSAGITRYSGPDRIVAGPDGNMWFTEQFGGGIARITPTGTVTEFFSGGSPDSIPAGSDGNLWFTYFGSKTIGRITPTGTFGLFNEVTKDTAVKSIAPGADGNLWVTVDRHTILRITPGGPRRFRRACCYVQPAHAGDERQALAHRVFEWPDRADQTLRRSDRIFGRDLRRRWPRMKAWRA